MVSKISFFPAYEQTEMILPRHDAWVVANPKTAGIIGGVRSP
jgi:hypothetical protein